MTTIAWDGFTLAGDRLVNYHGTALSGTKVFRREDGLLIGTSGDLDNTIPFKEWVLNGRSDKDKPTLDTAFSGIVIELDNSITYYTSKLIPSTINFKQWVLGSGGDYALGAMLHGATAKEAIAIATQLDVNTGLGIDEITR